MVNIGVNTADDTYDTMKTDAPHHHFLHTVFSFIPFFQHSAFLVLLKSSYSTLIRYFSLLHPLLLALLQSYPYLLLWLIWYALWYYMISAMIISDILSYNNIFLLWSYMIAMLWYSWYTMLLLNFYTTLQYNWSYLLDLLRSSQFSPHFSICVNG